MKRNTGNLDRIIRLVLAVAAIVGAAVLGWGTIAAIVLLIVAAILIVTAAVGFCPIYRLLGVNTCRVK